MTSEEALEAIRESREDLETLAESDLRCAKYAEKLLEVLDEAEGDHE